MSRFTFENLRSILREEAGADATADIDQESQDVPFVDLGYDSLALIQVASAIQMRHGVPLPDDAPAHMVTPREAVEYVNGLLASA